MNTISLTIPNMKSAHCQLTVSGVIERIGGAVKSIAPTRVEVEIKSGITSSEIVQAIENAGYCVG